MIKIYSNGESTQLSKHFNVREFRCKCGKIHDIKIDSDLIDKLERLFDKLNCSKIIVNSGYRCENHDKNVGGNGKGQHTKGTASDIVCYDKSDNIIPSTKVCCVAQDVGFNGIANIDSSYTATHVDTRTNGKWYGDESVEGGTTSSVCTDFYQHFGIKKETAKRTKDVTLSVDGVTYSGKLTEK